MNLRILVDKCNKKRGAKTMRGMLYLKIDRNNQVSHADVRLGDVAKLECVDASVKNRLKTMKLLKIQAQKSDRYVFSVMKVIEQIHEIYPELEIQNLGETDFIIEYESPDYAKDRFNTLKVAVLCILIFSGPLFPLWCSITTWEWMRYLHKPINCLPAGNRTVIRSWNWDIPLVLLWASLYFITILAENGLRRIRRPWKYRCGSMRMM